MPRSAKDRMASEVQQRWIEFQRAYLLDAIDNGLLRLAYTPPSGKVVDLEKDSVSEMAGWYMGSGG